MRIQAFFYLSHIKCVRLLLFYALFILCFLISLLLFTKKIFFVCVTLCLVICLKHIILYEYINKISLEDNPKLFLSLMPLGYWLNQWIRRKSSIILIRWTKELEKLGTNWRKVFKIRPKFGVLSDFERQKLQRDLKVLKSHGKKDENYEKKVFPAKFG